MTSQSGSVSEVDLQAYVDTSLAQERRREVEVFLSERPQEAERIRAYQEQNKQLHALFDSVLIEPLPSEWRNRPRRRNFPVKTVAAVLAGIVLGGVLGWTLRGEYGRKFAQSGDFVRQAAIAYTVYAPEVRHPVEVTADQEEHLVRWLSKRLGGPLRVPHLNGLGYELVGGRLLPGDQHPVAQFMYQNKNGQRLTLYIKTDPGAARETAFRFSQQGSVGVFYWIDRQLTYALSGEVGKDELLRVAQAVYQKLNP